MRLTVPDLNYSDAASSIKKILNSGWLTKGPYTVKFEDRVARFVGSRYAVALNSGTAALHLSLLACGIGPGDEVIVPDFTFVATANVIELCGAKPVLADIDLNTFNIDIRDMRNKISSKTKAIMPVHQFGLPCDMAEINKIARKKSLKVIEDAACAMGAKYKGKTCGSLADAGCFSFHPRKIITTGEGGIITTDNKKIFNFALSMRNHGSVDAGKGGYFDKAGYNYRLSEIQAALGLAQMKKLPGIIKKRIHLARLYNKYLNNTRLRMPDLPGDRLGVFQSYVVLLDKGIRREKLMKRLKAENIETTIGNYAVHATTYYKKKYGYRTGDLPNSYKAHKQTLTLPLYPAMRDKDVLQVCTKLNKLLENT